MNPGTAGGGMQTVVGDHCAFLANSHVGHDCRVGNNVIFSNNVMLAGHCTIGDFAILGGGAAVIQFARVGAHAFLGGMSGLENDLIPYGMALGNRAHLSGLNIIGLQRRGFSREDIHTLRRAYRLLFADEGTLLERLDDVEEEFESSDRQGDRGLHPRRRQALAVRAARRDVPALQRAWALRTRRSRAHDAHRHPGGRRAAAADDRRERGGARGRRAHRRHRGEADPEIARFPHTWVNWGQIGRMVATLRREGGQQLVIAGGVRRPDLLAHPARRWVSSRACRRSSGLLARGRRFGADARGALLRAQRSSGARRPRGGARPAGRRRAHWRRRAGASGPPPTPSSALPCAAALGALDAGQAVVVARRPACWRSKAPKAPTPCCERVAALPRPRGGGGRGAACWPRARSPARSCASTCRRSARAPSSGRWPPGLPAWWSRPAPCWCSIGTRPCARADADGCAVHGLAAGRMPGGRQRRRRRDPARV